jgi:uncharacterized protein (TIGR02453 family)
MVDAAVLEFLKQLTANNNRDWFAQNINTFRTVEKSAKVFFNSLHDELGKQDSLEKIQVFRIYRDIRFSKDKTPYKKFLSAWFSRSKPYLRGSYYIHLEPGNTFVEGGFWEPNAADLLRIRKEFELDDSEIRSIIAAENFKKYFGTLEGEELKTAPKDFDKSHPAIDLIRKKQFLIVRHFTDKEVLHKNFSKEVLLTFAAMRPFFDYMRDVLTTNLNGESTIELGA